MNKNVFAIGLWLVAFGVMAQSRGLEGGPQPLRQPDCDITSQHQRLSLEYRAHRYATCMRRSGTVTEKQIQERIDKQRRYEEAKKAR